MIQPFVKHIKTLLWRDAVTEHSDLSVPQEQVRQVVHARIARRVPDIQLQRLCAAAFIDFNALAEVGDYACRLLLSLAGALHECLDYASLANLCLAHEDNLCRLQLYSIFIHGRLAMQPYRVACIDHLLLLLWLLRAPAASTWLFLFRLSWICLGHFDITAACLIKELQCQIN